MPALTETERAALWLENQRKRQAQHAVLTTALQGSESARARIVAAWAPLIPDLGLVDEPEDDPQLANWNGA